MARLVSGAPGQTMQCGPCPGRLREATKLPQTTLLGATCSLRFPANMGDGILKRHAERLAFLVGTPGPIPIGVDVEWRLHLGDLL